MTSTDVAVRDTPSAALPDKIAYARALAGSGLLPAQYRAKPENVLFALEYGETLGITAMAAIQGVHVIEGKPTASGQLIAALVRQAGHRLRVTGNDLHAVAELTRHDDPEFTFKAEWTIDRAKKAGLAGKGTWAKHPGQMLKWRAITEAARDACPEVIFGLSTADETGPFDATPAGPVPSAGPVTVAELTGQPTPPAPPVDVESVRAAIAACTTAEELYAIRDDINTAGLAALARERATQLEEAERLAEQAEMEAELAQERS